MIASSDTEPDRREARVSGVRSWWLQCGVLGAVSALVIGVYASAAHSGVLESSNQNAADSYYNLLVQGFRTGQLSLKKDVPPGFAQLADPYDPSANAIYRSEPYRMLDMSYYRGRLYLYFGVTPALILFWPYAVLTGHYLFHRQAVAIFCALGFLASAGLLRALWRRYFAEVSIGVVAACVLALGLATGAPVLLSRSDVYEVPISCGYMLVMLALGAIWLALHEPAWRWRWLAAASLAYGLAVGARPSLLFSAVVLLAPVAQAWRERWPRKLSGLTAAAGPIILIGLGLMVYNALRFENPFEFGMRYQLAPDRMDTGTASFSLRYLWYHFRVYFLEPARWSSRFPFVHEITMPPWPAGHQGSVDRSFGIVTSVPEDMPFGILTNIPLVWLALAAPLAWRSQSAEVRSNLRRFLAAVGLLSGICALTICLFRGGNMRYEVDCLPSMVLLAVVGILGLERALATPGAGRAPKASGAGRPVRRQVARWGWGLLLVFSVAFNLLVGVENYAEADNNRGVLLAKAGRVQEAIAQYEWAVRIKPDIAEVHNNLGLCLQEVGRLDEAIRHYEEALRIKPDLGEAHYNLGLALEQSGRIQDAIGHWEQALRIKPDYADAHFSLGGALQHAGRLEEAIAHYEQALWIRPDYADAHYNFGVALEQEGMAQEAIRHYREALRIKPDDVDAQNALARSQAVR